MEVLYFNGRRIVKNAPARPMALQTESLRANARKGTRIVQELPNGMRIVVKVTK
jgi:hypothetical protein